MRLHEAFAAATRGRQKSLAYEHLAESRAESEMSLILAGKRRPTFDLIEAAFDADPHALFAYVAERFGVKVEKPAAPLAVQLELFGAQLVDLASKVNEALERAKAQERAGMASVPSREGAQRRRGA